MDSPKENIVSSSTNMPRAAKVGHKKSRLGCQRCKTRRVKCDEQKPRCGSCSRHNAECIYLDVTKSNTSLKDSSEPTQQRRRSNIPVRPRKSPSPTADMFPLNLTDNEGPEIPESRVRRLMELRLMQNFLMNGVADPQQPAPASEEWSQISGGTIPALSLEHDNVLYASLALSATHLLRSERDDEVVYSARQNYLVLALREQRKECMNITADNADAVCLCSIMILRNSFAMMQERSLENYTPPIEWLKMGRGAGAVMWKANAAVLPETPPTIKIFLDTYQHVMAEQAMYRDMDDPFASLWTAICEVRLSPEDREAYRKSLAYINSMQIAIDNKKGSSIIGRRLQTFPMVIPSRFIDLVEEGDDYALVVLAHLFGIAAQVDSEFWWLRGGYWTGDGGIEGRTALREIKAIQAHVSAKVRPLMLWPLMRIELNRR